MKNELAYNRALVDPATGLLVTSSSERDWDFYDGGKPGAVTAYNAMYYKALTDAAQIASDLAAKDPGNADAATLAADAATWTSQAATLKTAINATLFDAARGVYKLADRDNGTHVGHVGAAGRQQRGDQVRPGAGGTQAGHPVYLKSHLWGTFGPQPYSPDADYSTVISPFVTGMEVDARFAAGDTDGALALIHNHVGPDDRPERPVLHRDAVGEAQPGRHRRRLQRQPRARLGERPGVEPERLRAGRPAGRPPATRPGSSRRSRAREVGAGSGARRRPARLCRAGGGATATARSR